MDLLQVDFQDLRCGDDTVQHLQHRYGGVRCVPAGHSTIGGPDTRFHRRHAGCSERYADPA